MKTFVELWHLKELVDNNRDLYSPDGEQLMVVNNGFLGGQLLYDKKNKKVYGFKFVDLTKTAGKEFLDQCEYFGKLEELRYRINKKNINEIEKLINSLGEK